MSILELTYALVFPHPLDLGQFGQFGQLCQFSLCRFLNFMSLVISSKLPPFIEFFADNGFAYDVSIGEI